MIRCCECRYSYPNNSGGLWCWEKLNAKDDDSCDKGERIGGQNGKNISLNKKTWRNTKARMDEQYA